MEPPNKDEGRNQAIPEEGPSDAQKKMQQNKINPKPKFINLLKIIEKLN